MHAKHPPSFSPTIYFSLHIRSQSAPSPSYLSYFSNRRPIPLHRYNSSAFPHSKNEQDERSTSRRRGTQRRTDRRNERSRSQNNVRVRSRNGIRAIHTRVSLYCTFPTFTDDRYAFDLALLGVLLSQVWHWYTWSTKERNFIRVLVVSI